MPLLIRNLTLRLDEPEENLRKQIARVLEIPTREVRLFGIIRRSIDARNHHDLKRVYHVQCTVDGDEEKLALRGRPGQVVLLKSEDTPQPPQGSRGLNHRPIVIGTGPGGLLAALSLAMRGYMPLVLERGQDVATRHKALHQYYTQGTFDPENNLLFGIGGAGAYSDGKLYSRTHDPKNLQVLEAFVHYGADPDIAINAKPHLGSDRLPGVCKRIVDKIRELGGEVRFGAKVQSMELGEGAGEKRALKSLTLASGEKIETEVCLLATGHSARDIYRMLRAAGVSMMAKPFQMGVRIEHPQEMISKNQLGDAADKLPPADYMLVAKNAASTCVNAGPDLFSFCMCPGGTILPSNESANEICTNGASNSHRNSLYANSGLVVTIMPSAFNDDPLEGVEFQRKWESAAYRLSGSYAVPAQRARDYLNGKVSDGKIEVSYPLGSKNADLRNMLPDTVITALFKGLPLMDRMIPGFASNDGVLTGPETRASSPVRISRDEETRQSVNVEGLYPVGEGAGYAGGIVSSGSDGIKSAESVMAIYAPLKK